MPAFQRLCVDGTGDPAGLRCHEGFSETEEEQNNRKTRDRFVAEIAEAKMRRAKAG